MQKVLTPVPEMLSEAPLSRQRSAPFVWDTDNLSSEPLAPNSVKGHNLSLQHYLSNFIGSKDRRMPLCNLLHRLPPQVTQRFSDRNS